MINSIFADPYLRVEIGNRETRDVDGCTTILGFEDLMQSLPVFLMFIL